VALLNLSGGGKRNHLGSTTKSPGDSWLDAGTLERAGGPAGDTQRVAEGWMDRPEARQTHSHRPLQTYRGPRSRAPSRSATAAFRDVALADRNTPSGKLPALESAMRPPTRIWRRMLYTRREVQIQLKDPGRLRQEIRVSERARGTRTSTAALKSRSGEPMTHVANEIEENHDADPEKPASRASDWRR